MATRSASTLSQSRVDLIIKKGQDYEWKVRKAQEQRQIQEVEGCTFTPRILHKAATGVAAKKGELVYDHLYKTGVTQWQNRKSPKSTEQLEFEQAHSECTFRPQISRLG
jgi:hypothetical protein